jgi:hypothetical protein
MSNLTLDDLERRILEIARQRKPHITSPVTLYDLVTLIGLHDQARIVSVLTIMSDKKLIQLDTTAPNGPNIIKVI